MLRIEIPNFSREALQRIERARDQARNRLDDIRTACSEILEEAQKANEGYFDLDIGGMRFAVEESRLKTAEARTIAMLEYFDALAYESFIITPSVPEWEVQLDQLGAAAAADFLGDYRALAYRKREWISRTRGRAIIRNAVIDRAQVTFWRDLHIQFIAINRPDLFARLKNGWWVIHGLPFDETLKLECFRRLDSLFWRAVATMGFDDPSVALAVWLDLLNERSPHSVGWCVNNVCAASADYCVELEISAFRECGEVCKQSTIDSLGSSDAPALTVNSDKKEADGADGHGKVMQAVGLEGESEPTEEELSLVEQRKTLLAEYKAATKNPSNRSIYKARNSCIHKPEFYAWLGGELSPTSETTLNFEAFLRAKKPPLPRKEKY